MSDPIQELQKQIDTLWKQLTQTQQTQPLPYLVQFLIPSPTGTRVIPQNQRLVTGLESGVKGIVNLGYLASDGTIATQPVNLSQIGGVAAPIDVNMSFRTANAEASTITHDLSMMAYMMAETDPVGTGTAVPVLANLDGRQVVTFKTGNATVLDATNRASNHPFDRNPTTIARYFASVVGPHGVTSRWSYTVPAGKKFLVTSIFISVHRVTAAAPVGVAEGIIRKLTSNEFMARGACVTNTIGDGWNHSAGWSHVFLAGEGLEFITDDTSTGGTVEFVGATFGVEFDT